MNILTNLASPKDARNAIYRSVSFTEAQQSADWLHINGMSYIGPNHWYDDGDERFHPDNVIFSSRQANIVVIIDRTGSVVWRIGPDYRATEAMRALGQVSGQHHPHIIPIGLPGAGNLMFFDNGGSAGYGAGTPGGPDGRNVVTRNYSRVLEINPVTLEKVWGVRNSGRGEFSILQPQCEFGPTFGQWQYADHRRRSRPHIRSDRRKGNRVGICEPVFQCEQWQK